MYIVFLFNEPLGAALTKAIQDATGFSVDPVDRGPDDDVLSGRDDDDFRFIEFLGYNEEDVQAAGITWEDERQDAHRVYSAIKALELPTPHSLAFEDGLPHRSAGFAECEWCGKE